MTTQNAWLNKVNLTKAIFSIWTYTATVRMLALTREMRDRAESLLSTRLSILFWQSKTRQRNCQLRRLTAGQTLTDLSLETEKFAFHLKVVMSPTSSLSVSASGQPGSWPWPNCSCPPACLHWNSTSSSRCAPPASQSQNCVCKCTSASLCV